MFSAEFGIGEVHFRMGIHKWLQLVLLCRLIGSGLSLCFLLLIEHHFLYCLPCFSIQIRQFGVFWLNLLSIDLNISFNKAVPPVLLLIFLHGYLQGWFSSVTLYVPEALLSMNLLAPFSIDQWLVGLWLKSNSQLGHGNLDIKHFGCGVLWQLNIWLDLFQSLMPCIVFSKSSVTCIGCLLQLIFCIFFGLLWILFLTIIIFIRLYYLRSILCICLSLL